MSGPERFFHLMIEGLGTRQLWGLLLQSTLEYGSTFLLQRALLRRMSPERRAQSWNPLTWSTAIFWAGAFSMLPFTWVTRPSSGLRSGALAVLFGVLWTGLLIGLAWAGGEVITFVFDLAPQTASPAHG